MINFFLYKKLIEMENEKDKIHLIYKILKLSSLIFDIRTFVEDNLFFEIIKYNKRLQKMVNICLYDYQKFFFVQHFSTNIEQFNIEKLWIFIKSRYNNFDNFEIFKKLYNELIYERKDIKRQLFLDELENEEYYKKIFLKNIDISSLNNIKILELFGDKDKWRMADNILNLEILENNLNNLSQIRIAYFYKVNIPCSILKKLECFSLYAIYYNLTFSNSDYYDKEIILDKLLGLEIFDVYCRNNNYSNCIKFIMRNLQIIDISYNVKKSDNIKIYLFFEKYFGLNEIYQSINDAICEKINFSNLNIEYSKNNFFKYKNIYNLMIYKFTIFLQTWGYTIFIKKLNNDFLYSVFEKRIYDGCIMKTYFKKVELASPDNKLIIDIKRRFEGSEFIIDKFSFKHLEKLVLKNNQNDYQHLNDKKEIYEKILLFNIMNKDNLFLQEIEIQHLDYIDEKAISNFCNNIKYLQFLRILILKKFISNKNDLLLLLNNIINLKFVSKLNIELSLIFSDNEIDYIKNTFKNIHIDSFNNIIKISLKNKLKKN